MRTMHDRRSLGLVLCFLGMSTLAARCQGAPDATENSTHDLLIADGDCQVGLAANQISLHVDDQYRGRCARVTFTDDAGYGPGSFPFLIAGFPNDAVTSVALGANVEVVLRDDVAFSGQGLLVHSSQPNIGAFGFNDVTSSFYIQRRNENCAVVDNGQVCLFQDSSYNTGTFVGGSERRSGNYPGAVQMGIQNDSVSSMRVGSGVVVELCQNANYGNCTGEMVPGDYDVGALVSQGIGNDTASSMIVTASCRNVGGTSCGGFSASGACSCASNCGAQGNCCVDKFLVCGN